MIWHGKLGGTCRLIRNDFIFENQEFDVLLKIISWGFTKNP
uniref:Type IV secretion protein Rhs n=1 Tax=Heterorhabditis bacteriophora TaxID=37862 RepID=A0A1I7WQY5_HETBA